MTARHRPRKPSEAFLRRPALIGEEAPVDWAHFGEVEVDGTKRKLAAFALVLRWSRKMVLRFGFEMTRTIQGLTCLRVIFTLVARVRPVPHAPHAKTAPSAVTYRGSHERLHDQAQG
jgi:hypothetical protein